MSGFGHHYFLNTQVDWADVHLVLEIQDSHSIDNQS
jgi:hypothetical protein